MHVFTVFTFWRSHRERVHRWCRHTESAQRRTPRSATFAEGGSFASGVGFVEKPPIRGCSWSNQGLCGILDTFACSWVRYGEVKMDLCSQVWGVFAVLVNLLKFRLKIAWVQAVGDATNLLG